MSGTSEIGAMYRQLLAARGVPANGENMQRLVAESRRTPGLIPGLTVQGEDTPNQSAASMPTQPGVPNSGVAPPMTPQPTQPLPVPPTPPSYGGLPVIDNMHPGATSPGGVIPGTGVTPGSMPTVGPQAATPSSPMSPAQSPMSGASPPPVSAAPMSASPSGIAAQVLGDAGQSQPPAPLQMPSAQGDNTDSADIAQMILGLGAAGGAGLAPLWAQQNMGNAGPRPFRNEADRQAPAPRKSPSGAPDSGVSVGQSGNVAADIERPGSSPTAPITSRVGSDGKLRLQEGGSSDGAVVKSDSIPMRDETSGPTIRGQNQGSGPPIATEAPSLDRQAQLLQQSRRVGRTPSFRGIRIP